MGPRRRRVRRRVGAACLRSPAGTCRVVHLTGAEGGADRSAAHRRAGRRAAAAARARADGEWVEDFPAAVRRAFARPDVPALAGWEPLTACRERVVPAVRRVLDVHGDEDVVLVGHGTAWTLVVAELTGQPPDLDRWESLAMPDLLTVDT
ncbi:hypothetical protein CFI00_15290 [Nocardioides sp. S5]|nr:hypothetical protein CFI00_15290 [Nocardioides sp. S5]